MAKLNIITILLIGLFTACTPVNRAPRDLPTPHVALVETKALTKIHATPTSQSTLPKKNIRDLTDSCNLLDSRDLAGFFPPHVETQLPKPQLNQVDHPTFSEMRAPGTETSCIYYTFYRPGSTTMVMLQTTYWVDIPASALVSQAWAQAWEKARSKALRKVSDIADGAFYNDGRLSFKEGNMYVTVEAIETDWSRDSPANMDKQFAVEKQIVLDMLLNHE